MKLTKSERASGWDPESASLLVGLQVESHNVCSHTF